MIYRFRVTQKFTDVVERLVLAVLFVGLVSRLLLGAEGQNLLINGLYVVDQLLALLFLLFRRPASRITQSVSDWLAAFGGSFLPLMVIAPSGDPLLPPFAVVAMLLLGIVVHLVSKLYLRRSFGVVAAVRELKMTGPYRYVRHPMYLGYFLAEVAWLLAGPNLTNALILGATWLFQLCRIRAEERLLREDALYVVYCEKTPYRIFPGIY